MIINVKEQYKLKEGTEPVYGNAQYGAENLIILEVDFDDLTVHVKPEGFSDAALFWARFDDLEEEII